MSDKPLTHIVGTFLIQAEGAFLNGSTKDTIEGYDATTPKLLKEFKDKIPYVSAQAWRHWLRETFKEEYPNEPSTPIETTKSSEGEGNQKNKLTTSKVGVKIDPIRYAEHDIFGYMNVKEGQGKGDVKPTIRSSPFQSSILLSVRKSGWEGIDKGFVYPKTVALSLYRDELNELIEKDSKLKETDKAKVNELIKIIDTDITREELVTKLEEGLKSIEKNDKIDAAIRKITLTVSSPLPYTTRFYNTHLQGIFGLAFHRLGLFRNGGDREEIDNVLVDKYKSEKQLQVVRQPDKSAEVYELTDRTIRQTRTEMILRSLVRLRGGAKQAQFGTDVSPKVIIVAGLSCGNLIFNDLFEDTKEIVTNPREGKDAEVIESQVVGGVRLKLNTLKQVIWDYKDRLKTSVYIGVRSGYLSKTSEDELKKWTESQDKWNDIPFVTEQHSGDNLPNVKLCSPIDAIEGLLSELGNMEKK